MNRVLLSAILSMLSMCFLLGCTGDPRIWGVWKWPSPDETRNVYITFSINGTFSIMHDDDISCDISGRYWFLIDPHMYGLPPESRAGWLLFFMVKDYDPACWPFWGFPPNEGLPFGFTWLEVIDINSLYLPGDFCRVKAIGEPCIE